MRGDYGMAEGGAIIRWYEGVIRPRWMKRGKVWGRNLRRLELLLAERELQFLCHSDELRERLSFHFPHHMPAMDLDGDFTGSKFESYLFVEHTRNHQAHDLALARCQRLVALSQLSKLMSLLAC